ncbi:MAG: hypothetical protein JW384_03061 [Nitrosomonadaceae bacterium]|nr:hypothetical protein [Nitrosomonadaceae bacterium]
MRPRLRRIEIMTRKDFGVRPWGIERRLVHVDRREQGAHQQDQRSYRLAAEGVLCHQSPEGADQGPHHPSQDKKKEPDQKG